MANRERGISATAHQTIRASECCLAVMNSTKTSDECKNYTLHFFICQHRHPAVFEVTHGKTPATVPAAKPTEEKTRKRAGATPLCAAFSRPIEPWGRSRLPRAARGRVFSTGAENKNFVRHRV